MLLEIMPTLSPDWSQGIVGMFVCCTEGYTDFAPPFVSFRCSTKAYLRLAYSRRVE